MFEAQVKYLPFHPNVRRMRTRCTGPVDPARRRFGRPLAGPVGVEACYCAWIRSSNVTLPSPGGRRGPGHPRPRRGRRAQPGHPALSGRPGVLPSLKIRYRELLSSLSQRPGLFLLALLGVFGLVPLLMYALGRVAGLSPLLLTGFGARLGRASMVSSPFFTGLIHGDIGFAFTVAVSSTLLAPLTIPLTVYLLLGQSTTLQLSYLVRTASLVIFAPALLAALVRRYVPRTAAQILSAEHICTTVAICHSELGDHRQQPRGDGAAGGRVPAPLALGWCRISASSSSRAASPDA